MADPGRAGRAGGGVCPQRAAGGGTGAPPRGAGSRRRPPLGRTRPPRRGRRQTPPLPSTWTVDWTGCAKPRGAAQAAHWAAPRASFRRARRVPGATARRDIFFYFLPPGGRPKVPGKGPPGRARRGAKNECGGKKGERDDDVAMKSNPKRSSGGKNKLFPPLFFPAEKNIFLFVFLRVAVPTAARAQHARR